MATFLKQGKFIISTDHPESGIGMGIEDLSDAGPDFELRKIEVPEALHGQRVDVVLAKFTAVASAQHDYPGAILVALSPGWVQTDMGGAGAPLSVHDSVAAMRRTLASLTPQHRGAFLDHDGTRFATW
mgnify:CR=1 FL=1